MSPSLSVIIGNAVAGTLTLAGRRVRFEYDDDYRLSDGATPLSVAMPLAIREHADAVVTPWLWGLLPDNPKVLDQWARKFHASAASPFSILATPVGHDCPGAVRFTSPETVDELLRRRGGVKWLSGREVADRLRDLKRDQTAWLGRQFTGQFSLAGAQAKTALLFENGRWGEPSGARATTHILKPAVAGLDDHDLNEHLCMDAARRAGLTVARTHIEHFGTESAIVVERYDRFRRNDHITRIHQEDLCQALGVLPTNKYEKDGGPSAPRIVELFRQVMRPAEADDAIWRFVDALAWNWLLVATDAHAKNYSMLLAGDQTRLAPLYDIASALPYEGNERRLKLAMKIGGDYRIWPRRNLWGRVAAEMALDTDRLVERVRALTEKAPDCLLDAANARQVKQLKRELPPRLVDLVARRARVCAAILRMAPTPRRRRALGT